MDNGTSTHSILKTSLYTPLSSPSSIRLLSLSTPPVSKVVHGTLVEHTIEDAKLRKYIAASYYWGKPVFDHEIILDGHTTHVTKSVFEMLNQFAEEAPGLYWIDQVCINQKDLEERAAQVLLMTQIYQNAEQVHVWLGGEHEQVKSVYQWVLEIVPKLVDIWESEETGAADKLIAKSNLLSESHPPAELDVLFESEWFTRLWVVQEVTVNPNPVVMWRGPIRMDFDVLSDFGLLLERWRRESLLSHQASIGIDLLTELRQIRDPRYYHLTYTTNREEADLLDLVSSTWRRQCLDPRDRLYALAGLANPQHLPYPPTYVEPVETIFMDYALYRIMKSGNLRILEWCRWTPQRLSNLPSWAPDWTNVHSQLGTPWKHREQRRIYSAGGQNQGQNQSLSISRPKRALITRGIIFDHVNTVLGVKELCELPNINAGLGAHQLELGNCIEMLMQLLGPFSPVHVPWNDFWRFLFCDKSINEQGEIRAVSEDATAARVFVNSVVNNAQVSRFEKQKELIAAGNLSSEVTLLEEPVWGQPLAEFMTRPPEIIRLPSNPILCYLKEKSIAWEMKYDGVRSSATKALRKLKQRVRPTAPVELKYKDPVANPNNQFQITQDAGWLFQYLTRGRSFAITESGRLAWVPDTARGGDQIAVILAYDLPMVIRQVQDDELLQSSSMKYSKHERPDQYLNYDANTELQWASDDEEAEIEDPVEGQTEEAIAEVKPPSSHAPAAHATPWPRLKTRQRVVGDKYLIIGEAYVHGVMDGEIVDNAAAEMVQEITFV